MPIKCSPLNATLGAVIRDVDLKNLNDATWSELYAAFLEYGVLVFPDQHLDDEAQTAFARRFGEIESLSPKHKGGSVPISNRKTDGSLAQPGEYVYQLLHGNEGWHTDSTYMPLASKAAMLSAIELPPTGGETGFADMRAGWDALDAETQNRLLPLSAYHSLYYSQARAGFIHQTDNLYGLHDKGAPLRPVIKTHPETGRKSIYTGRHAYGVPGLSPAQSEALLDELMENACRPPRVYKHEWRVGDTVVWDNRCVMHRAYPYDIDQPRVLRGTRISGDPQTESAPTFPDEWKERLNAANPNEPDGKAVSP